MIQANELRIGNYVYDDFNEIHRVESVQSNRLIEYNGSGDPNVIISKLDGCDRFYVSDYVNPIPLTEEILLKCGFEKFLKGIKGSDIHDTYRLGFFQIENHFGIYLFHGIEIKHTHQLQNLFFAISGHELNIEL